MTNEEIDEINRICDKLTITEQNMIDLADSIPQLKGTIVLGDTVINTAKVKLRSLMKRVICYESQSKHIPFKRKLNYVFSK